MPGLSDFIEQRLAEHIFKLSTWTPPTTFYVGPSRAPLNDLGGGNDEPWEDPSYARAAIGSGSANWNNASGRSISNKIASPSFTASQNWGTMTDFGVWSDPTSELDTDLIYLGVLSSPVNVSAGETWRINPGGLVISQIPSEEDDTGPGGLSDQLVRKYLNFMCGLSTWDNGAGWNLYVAVCESQPLDSDTGTTLAAKEPGFGYARTQHSTGWQYVGFASVSNSTVISSVAASGGPWNITHFGVLDSSTGGELLFHAPVTTPMTVNSGSTALFPSGSLICRTF